MRPILVDVPEELAAERIVLRAIRPGWGERVNEAAIESLAELRPWMPWAQSAPSVADSEEWCRRAAGRMLLREELQYGLFRREDELFLGDCGVPRLNWEVMSFEIGYWLRSSCVGRGYMVEAVGCLTQFLQDRLKARRVEIRVDDRNRRSQRVAERAGFDLEGTLRCVGRTMQGGSADMRVYARVRDEESINDQGSMTNAPSAKPQ